MKSYNMLFAGFGGQGVLFTGKVCGYCAIIDGREVSWLPSYGPEMRGGTANCSVCIDDEPISCPVVSQPNVLVAMNSPSFDKFIDTVEPGGMAIVDSSLIDRKNKRTDISFYAIPATQVSNDEHLEGIPNMILLGKLLKEVAFTTLETLEESLKKCIPARKSDLLVHNKRAIQIGMTL